MPEGQDTHRDGSPRADRGKAKGKPSRDWQHYHDPDQPPTERSVWQAIADANDLDYSDIADGDLVEWL
jgi:hypothetical protein